MSIERCHLQKQDPCQERWRMILARLWVNGLRSNATPLELCKLDIVSTSNNLWVRRATLIVISLVLRHHTHWEEPQASTDKEFYNYIERACQCPLALNCLRNPTLAESSNTTLEDEPTMWPLKVLRRPDVILGWKLATLEEMYPQDNMP
jgi:hypothetical protein